MWKLKLLCIIIKIYEKILIIHLCFIYKGCVKLTNHERKNNSFALRLKLHREICHLTQQQVADILNINRTTYTKYETGVSEPSHEVLGKIVSIFGVDYNTLLGKGKLTPVVQDPFDNEFRLNNLSNDEKMLVIAYRVMSDEDKKSILDSIKERVKREKAKGSDENSD